MTVRDIVKFPDKRLKLKSEPVKYLDSHVRALVNDMLDTMYDAPGIGLAAIQIGIAVRIVVIDVSKKEDAHERHILINPEIVWASEETMKREEGCLSIPEQYEQIERSERVTVKFRNLDGEEREIDANGMLATCIQHEVDHTNGILFIDHLSRLKRDLFVRKYRKFTKAANAPKKRVEA